MNLTTKNQFPQGWDKKRVKKIINHYENQSEDEAVIEDETILVIECRIQN